MLSVSLSDGAFHVVDEVIGRTFTAEVDDDAEIGGVRESDSPIRRPVDIWTPLRTDHIRISNPVSCYVTSGEETVAVVPPDGDASLESGTYDIDIGGEPLDVYFHVDGPIRTSGGSNREFDVSGTEVCVGIRSNHISPVGEVVVPPEISSVATALGYLGTGMTEWSPERSWPSLRPSPPTFSLDQSADRISSGQLTKPSTGVEILVPERWECLYRVVPLTFYFGAKVVAGAVDLPVLISDDGRFKVPIRSVGDVRDVLEHCFLLDCLVRKAGYYDFDLRSTARIQDRLDDELDVERLYHAPLVDRTEEYLSIPRSATEDLITWPTVADVEPTPDRVPLIGRLAEQMTLVRSPPKTPETSIEPSDALGKSDGAFLDDFYREDDDLSGFDDIVATTTPNVDAVSHVWAVDTIGYGSANPLNRDPRHDLEETELTDGGIDVLLIGNGEMTAEVRDLYRWQDEFSLRLTITVNPSASELRELLADSWEFVHYAGHVSEDGLECSNAPLDLATVPDPDIDAFLLNGCSSFSQGRALVENGATGGVVTTEAVANSSAVLAGRSVARLLNAGWPLDGAVSVVQDVPRVPMSYAIIGEASTSVSSPPSGIPMIPIIDTRRGGAGEAFVDIRAVTTRQFGLGSAAVPAIDTDVHEISSGTVLKGIYDIEDISSSLSSPGVVCYDGSIRWKSSVDALTDVDCD